MHSSNPNEMTQKIMILMYTMKGWMECVIPENIHTPATDGQWKFLGGGGLKGRNFQGVQGVPTRIIFHRIVKDTIDHTRHT